MPKPKSLTLFHFTKTVESLCGILESGFFPRYSLEDISWLGFDTTPNVAIPVVCFCDIPLSRISEHIGFYGNFGIGLTKEWAMSNGLNPLLYVSSTSSFTTHFSEVMSAVTDIESSAEKESEKDPVSSLRHIVAFTKPLEGVMFVGNNPVQKEFYQESEWRFVARGNGVVEFLGKDDYSNNEIRKAKNATAAEKCALSFAPKDVKYIFVSKDSEIPHLVNFINNRLDKYPSADLKILTTRITSIESIANDL